MWLYHQESNETREKLMKEYQLTLEEYSEVTKPPICILPMKDPITGIRKFPEDKELTEKEIEKIKRENIERNYGFAINKLSIKTIKKYLIEKYNISEEELLYAIASATSNLKNKPPIRIRRDWSLMVEAYLRGKKEKEDILKDAKKEYMTEINVDDIDINIKDLSIESLKNKLGFTHQRAIRIMGAIEYSYDITPQGIIEKEKDIILRYIEPVIILRSSMYEKMYERTISIIKEMVANDEIHINSYVLASKVKIHFNIIQKVILKMLNEMRIVEYTHKDGYRIL